MTRTLVGAAAAVALLATPLLAQDWPQLRGGPDHRGYADAPVPPAGKPQRLWVRHFAGERLGSAMEPIVGDGRVFVATHSGHLYALDAETGDPIWRFATTGAFLHSPAYADGRVFAGSTDGCLYSVDAKTGKLAWREDVGLGGVAASPAVAGAVYVGTRSGDVVAADSKTGRVLWKVALRVPVRQTATVVDGRIYVTSEDLRVRRIDAATGTLVWSSEPLQGQSARDYYPVVAKAAGRTFVIVRTNLVVPMPAELTRDTAFLCKTSGVDGSNWKALDAWCKGDQVRGSAEAIEKEGAAIVRELEARPESKTFFVLDAESGKEAMTAPVFWAGGCQGVGAPPVVLPDGRLQVFYRTAFTNWSHGVAPLVSLGAFDLSRNRVEPWFHENGHQPPWNTFWGTADEAQNFVVAGDALLIVHQATLSSFDLKTRKLAALAGERDGWGGFRNLPWARNEWNGPARGGVALCGKRLYWLTGSRVHCYLFGGTGKPADDVEIDGGRVPTLPAPAVASPDPKVLLGGAVEEVLSHSWAPLYTQQGIGGREFFFESSADLFEALALAYRHLSPELQARVKKALAAEWERHSPVAAGRALPLDEGERREWFPVPKSALVRGDRPRPPHVFGNVFVALLYASRCGEKERVEKALPSIKKLREEFLKEDPRSVETTALYAQRYLASLVALAGEVGKEDPLAAGLEDEIRALARELDARWKRAAESPGPRVYKDVSAWDGFIVKGEDGAYQRIIPHNHKLALFRDLSPATLPRDVESPAKVWREFEGMSASWFLSGEERQVHYGENYVDPPDFALAAFRAYAWVAKASREDLIRRVDVPFCKADLTWIIKLAIACDSK